MATNSLRLNFESPKGGVALFLNGFLLYDGAAGEDASINIAPFLRPGDNTIEIQAFTPVAQARVSILDLSGGDPPIDAPRVFQSEIDSGAMGVPDVSFFIIDKPTAEFRWHDAVFVEDPSLYSDALHSLANTLAERLQYGPDDQLLNMLAMKHAEIGEAVGLSHNEMDEGLRRGLGDLRDQPEFSVQCAQYDDFRPIISRDGRILNLRRKSGGHAVRIMDQMANPGFRVAVARLDDRWQIVR